MSLFPHNAGAVRGRRKPDTEEVERPRKQSRSVGASAGDTLARPVGDGTHDVGGREEQGGGGSAGGVARSSSSSRGGDVGGREEQSMGVGISACKGMVHPNSVGDPGGEEGGRSLSTVTRVPFLSPFEDRAPFKPAEALSDKDESLLKALTHHRTPYAVVETDSPELNIIYASGGCVAGLGMPAESIEGSSLAAVLKKGIQALPADVERLEAAVRAKEVRLRHGLVWLLDSSDFFSRHTAAAAGSTHAFLSNLSFPLCFLVLGVHAYKTAKLSPFVCTRWASRHFDFV